MLPSRHIIDALLPGGPLWTPEPGAELDNLLDGIADSLDPVQDYLAGLAHLRNPLKTPILSDLEKEYGVASAGSDTERRDRLAGIIEATRGDGSLDFLQSVLRKAGFAVSVHANDPPVDPATFVFYGAGAVFGNPAAMFGKSRMSARRGELLVNGPVFKDQVRYYYSIPTGAGYWPLFCFVGGEATRNGDGELTDIADAPVLASRRNEFVRTVLKCKPLHVWVGLRVRYV